MPSLNPDRIKIGYVILIAGCNTAIQTLQRKAGYGDSAKWTHVAGSIGGFDAVEAKVPQSHVINLQREYVDKGYEIKSNEAKGPRGHEKIQGCLMVGHNEQSAL